MISKKETFKIPKQVRVRDILIKAGPQDTPDQLEAKKKKTEEIWRKQKRQRILVPWQSSILKRKMPLKGGDLGWIQKGTLGEQIESILFSMKSGD